MALEVKDSKENQNQLLSPLIHSQEEFSSSKAQKKLFSKKLPLNQSL